MYDPCQTLFFLSLHSTSLFSLDTCNSGNQSDMSLTGPNISPSGSYMGSHSLSHNLNSAMDLLLKWTLRWILLLLHTSLCQQNLDLLPFLTVWISGPHLGYVGHTSQFLSCSSGYSWAGSNDSFLCYCDSG